MPLVLEPCSPDDGAALGHVHYISTRTGHLTELVLGSCDRAEARAMMTRNFVSYLEASFRDGSQDRYLKIIDTEKEGELIAYAAWTLPADQGEKEEGAGKETGWESQPKPPPRSGVNMELSKEYMAQIMAMRKEVLGEKRHYLLGNLATSPMHQRRGAASMLVKWPFEQADKEGVIVYLDTDHDGSGLPLYTKLGFVQVGECHIDLSKFGSQGIHTKIAMIREPKVSIS